MVATRRKGVSMDEQEQTYEEFLNAQTKEQIIIFLHNTELQLESLRNRMEKLTGCREFGALDGMNGVCQTCFYEEKPLFDKCWDFVHKTKWR